MKDTRKSATQQTETIEALSDKDQLLFVINAFMVADALREIAEAKIKELEDFIASYRLVVFNHESGRIGNYAATRKQIVKDVDDFIQDKRRRYKTINSVRMEGSTGRRSGWHESGS